MRRPRTLDSTGRACTPPSEEPVLGRVTHGRYQSLAFTAALRAGGVIAAQMPDEPTGDRFVAHVGRALVLAPLAGDVAVMDDLPCHKRAGGRAAKSRPVRNGFSTTWAETAAKANVAATTVRSSRHPCSRQWASAKAWVGHDHR